MTAPIAFLRLPELAATLKLSPRSVRRLVAQRRIPAIRLSRRLLLFDPHDVAQAIRKAGGQ